MLKKLMLYSALLLNTVTAFCCDHNMEEKPFTRTAPNLLTAEHIHLDFTAEIKSVIQYRDIQSLNAGPSAYTPTIQKIKKTLDNFPLDVRTHLNKWIQETSMASPEKRRREAIKSYKKNLQAKSEENQSVSTNVSLQSRVLKDCLDKNIYRSMRIEDSELYIQDYYFLTDVLRGIVDILSNKCKGYFDVAMAISKSTNLPLGPQDIIKFLDLYMERSADYPIKEYISKYKMMITNNVINTSKENFINEDIISNNYRQALEEMTRRLEDYYQNYGSNDFFNLVKLGRYPVKGSKDRALLDSIREKLAGKYQTAAGDFEKAYVHFVQLKYEELGIEYSFGTTRMVPRTDRFEIRQDFKKALKLLNESATMLSDEFGGNSPIEKANYKIFLTDTPFYRYHQNLLNDDAHPNWQVWLPLTSNQVTNTKINSPLNLQDQDALGKELFVGGYIKEYIRSYKITIASQYNAQDLLDEMIEKIKCSYQSYYDDDYIKLAESGDYPMQDSKDKKILDNLREQYSGDFQKAYVHFVQLKYEELGIEYSFGTTRMVPRTDRFEIRQDFKKALKLLNDSAIMLADKFGSNNLIEKACYKIFLTDTPFYRYHQNLLNDDAHPNWQVWLPLTSNQVINTDVIM